MAPAWIFVKRMRPRGRPERLYLKEQASDRVVQPPGSGAVAQLWQSTPLAPERLGIRLPSAPPFFAQVV